MEDLILNQIPRHKSLITCSDCNHSCQSILRDPSINQILQSNPTKLCIQSDKSGHQNGSQKNKNSHARMNSGSPTNLSKNHQQFRTCYLYCLWGHLHMTSALISGFWTGEALYQHQFYTTSFGLNSANPPPNSVQTSCAHAPLPLTGHLCPQDVPLRAQLPAQRRARHVPRHRREDLGGDVRQGRPILLQNRQELRFRSINEFGTYTRWFLLDPPPPAADDGVVAFLE